MTIVNLLRSAKRRLLTDGYAETVYNFIQDVKGGSGVFKHPKDKYLVNLSFDFEFGYGTTFWEGNIEKSLSYGSIARKNFVPMMKYMRETRIPANVQVVGALFDNNVQVLPIFSQVQREAMFKNQELFRLTSEDIELLNSTNIEAGLHGFSHRHFTNMSRQDAEYEMINATDNFKNSFGKSPEFMGFPKNCVAYTDIVQKHGIKYWRADSNHPKHVDEIPLGHWFAPGVLGGEDLRRILSTLKSSYDGYFLHLWGHFTEMNLDTFKELVETIKQSGWKLTTVKEFKKY